MPCIHAEFNTIPPLLPMGMQGKNFHVVGRAGGSPGSFRGCRAAHEFRAERQTAPCTHLDEPSAPNRILEAP
jgi:hypothetical protein